MKASIISTALALLAGRAYTAPTPAQAIQARQFEASITFIGVGPTDSYFMQFPTNAEPLPIGTSHRQR